MSINFKEIANEAAKLLSELIKIDTTNPPGNELPAAELIAELMKDYGYDPIVLESERDRGNVIVRLEGRGEGPSLMLLSHLDVVPADPSRWTFDPFSGEIKDGYVLGRGALDCKGLVAIEAMIMRLLAEEKRAPKGDIIFAATADEEKGGIKGVRWLIENKPELVKADYVINEGGGYPIRINDRIIYTVQVAEKGVFCVRIKVFGKSAHASVPGLGENSIIKISEIIKRISEYTSQVKIIPPVKLFLTEISKVTKTALAELLLDPNFVDNVLNILANENKIFAEIVRAMIRNTFTPTMIKGGLKENIIPPYTELILDCRVLPGIDKTGLLNELNEILKGLDCEIEVLGGCVGTESPYNTTLFNIIEKTIKNNVTMSSVVPIMSTGSTDSKHFRLLTNSICYGFWPKSPESTIEKIIPLVHGVDERISINDLEFGIKVLYEIVKTMMY